MTDRTIKLVIGTVFILSFLFAKNCYAITLLTEKEALQRVFANSQDYISETKTLSDEITKNLKERLGGNLVNHTKGPNARELMQQNRFDFYFNTVGGQKQSVAIIIMEPGKFGPIKFIVHMDLNGEILEMLVMSYTETRGRPIARKNFLKQFEGKTFKDPYKIRKDIVPISGATISSTAAAFTAKKATNLYNIFYIN